MEFEGSYFNTSAPGFAEGKLIVVMSRIGIATVWFLLAYLASCSDSNTVSFVPDCSGVSFTFSTDVSPLISSSCAINSGCHGAGSTRGPGALITYQQIFNSRNGIKSSVASGRMPRNGSLTANEKNIIICWVDNGAQNN